MHNLFQEQTSAYAKKIGVMLWWTVTKCSISREPATPAPPQESVVAKKAADAISRLSMLLEDL
jgi:hypothetical protein